MKQKRKKTQDLTLDWLISLTYIIFFTSILIAAAVAGNHYEQPAQTDAPGAGYPGARPGDAY